MPLHLDSIMNDTSSEAFAFIAQTELQAIDDAWAENSKIHFMGSKDVVDAKSGKQIGKYVFTFFSNIKKKRNEVLDLDIVLNSAAPVELELLVKYPESSDSNEYYEVQTIATEQHFNIETVNRYMIPTTLLHTRQTVYCSAFPFQLTIFYDVAAYNKFCGFGNTGVNVGGTDFTVHGLDERFISPGDVFQEDKSEDEPPWSLVAGTIKSYEDATLSFGNQKHEVIIAQLDTALGVLPTLIGKEVFDVRNIAVGKIIFMNAYIKANFSNGIYPKPNSKETTAEPTDEPKKRKSWFRRK